MSGYVVAGKKNGEHVFGGAWTQQKLKVLEGYLHAYVRALKNKGFTIGFIDAFAGTGSRSVKRPRPAAIPPPLLLPTADVHDLGTDAQNLLDGSARIALQIKPSFDAHIFIEKDKRRCQELERLRHEYRDKSITILNGDANVELQNLCSKDWQKHRAVVFLDPYGLQVDWSTIEAIAETKAIDLWLLFPLGVGVNRMLPKDGRIPEGWRKRLDVFFGTSDWYDEFYRVETRLDLFGQEVDHLTKSDMWKIADFYLDRLRGVFAGVTDAPGVLSNSHNNPIYLLCFAVGNPRGKKIALRIARHLLQDLH